MGCVESLVHVYNASLVHVNAPYQESDLSIPDPSRRLTRHTPYAHKLPGVPRVTVMPPTTREDVDERQGPFGPKMLFCSFMLKTSELTLLFNAPSS